MSLLTETLKRMPAAGLAMIRDEDAGASVERSNMTRRFVVALAVLIAASGCARNGGQVASDDIVAEPAPSPTAEPSPTPPAQPVELQGPVNNIATQDLTGMGSAAEVEIEMADFSFNPTFVKLAPAANVKISLKNVGSLADHTFTIDSMGVDRQLEPAEEVEVVIQVPVSGVVPFYCRLHLDKGMQGAFFFNEGDPAAITPASSTASPTQTSGSGTTSTAARRSGGAGSSNTTGSTAAPQPGPSGESDATGSFFIPDVVIDEPVGGSIGGTQSAPAQSQNPLTQTQPMKPQTKPTISTPAKANPPGVVDSSSGTSSPDQGPGTSSPPGKDGPNAVPVNP